MGQLIFLFFILIFPFVHGDLHQRIQDLTLRIESHPDSISLYQYRGELYVLHEDFQLAHDDFSHCLQQGFTSPRVFLGLSQTFEKRGSLDSSMYFVNKALDADPNWISAEEWKARLYFLMKNPCASATVYELLIEKLDQPSPVLYLDASDALINCTQHDAYQRSIDLIKKGLTQIGPLHVLQNKLVEIYVNHKDYDEALRIKSELIEHSANHILPLIERAAIYRAKKDFEHARNDLNQALLALDALPNFKSGTPAMAGMRNTILYSLDHLEE